MVKRVFDVFLAFVIGGMLLVPMFFIWVLVSITSGSNGLFYQQRIGRYGKQFTIYKFKTILWEGEKPRITRLGKYLRKYKIDEVPQLYNILNGTMSFVGPRPDLAGFYDVLEGEDRKVLLLKPGLTSRASILYFNEEDLLQEQENSEEFNKNVLFPAKVKLNLNYYYTQSLRTDLSILKDTFICLVQAAFRS